MLSGGGGDWYNCCWVKVRGMLDVGVCSWVEWHCVRVELYVCSVFGGGS